MDRFHVGDMTDSDGLQQCRNLTIAGILTRDGIKGKKKEGKKRKKRKWDVRSLCTTQQVLRALVVAVAAAFAS